MSNTPPPIPPPGTPRKSGTNSDYDLMADKVGFLPNVRKKDNLYQGLCIAVCVIIGMIAGWFWDGGLIREIVGNEAPLRILVGGAAGLIVGTLASGLFLMVLGLRRKR